MSPVSLLLNIVWIVLGGAWMAFGWLVAAVIMAIMECAMTRLREGTGGLIRAEDIVWTLTVPAIWGEEAKQIMREGWILE